MVKMTLICTQVKIFELLDIWSLLLVLIVLHLVRINPVELGIYVCYPFEHNVGHNRCCGMNIMEKKLKTENLIIA